MPFNQFQCSFSANQISKAVGLFPFSSLISITYELGLYMCFAFIQQANTKLDTPGIFSKTGPPRLVDAVFPKGKTAQNSHCGDQTANLQLIFGTRILN